MPTLHRLWRAILQDRYGFMWFGTADGLNRYDGYSFTHFVHDVNDSASIADNRTIALLEDGRFCSDLLDPGVPGHGVTEATRGRRGRMDTNTFRGSQEDRAR